MFQLLVMIGVVYVFYNLYKKIKEFIDIPKYKNNSGESVGGSQNISDFFETKKPAYDCSYYTKKDFLMTKAENNFFKVLQQVVQDKYYIVPQVQLSNLVNVFGYGRWAYQYKNKINLKSVDFVLYDKEHFTPQVVIELDDSSHEREDRKERDNFVDSVMQKIGIKIVHIKTAYQYDLNMVEKKINFNQP